MNKFPRNLKAKDVLKQLHKHGFIEVGRRGSHVRLKHADGRWTQVAVHPKPIPVGTLKAILKQTQLSLEEFIKK